MVAAQTPDTAASRSAAQPRTQTPQPATESTDDWLLSDLLPPADPNTETTPSPQETTHSAADPQQDSGDPAAVAGNAAEQIAAERIAAIAADMQSAAAAIGRPGGEAASHQERAIQRIDELLAAAQQRLVASAAQQKNAQEQAGENASQGQPPEGQREAGQEPPENEPGQSPGMSDRSDEPAASDQPGENDGEGGEQQPQPAGDGSKPGGSGESPPASEGQGGQSGSDVDPTRGQTDRAIPRDRPPEVKLKESLREVARMQWGNLPQRLRDQVGSPDAAKFAPGYEQATAEYFQRLRQQLPR